MLETLAMFSNVQPQLQPHLPQRLSFASPHQTAPGTPRVPACHGSETRRDPHGPEGQGAVVGANAFYEKVIKVKADVAAFLINCFPSA